MLRGGQLLSWIFSRQTPAKVFAIQRQTVPADGKFTFLSPSPPALSHLYLHTLPASIPLPSLPALVLSRPLSPSLPGSASGCPALGDPALLQGPWLLDRLDPHPSGELSS